MIKVSVSPLLIPVALLVVLSTDVLAQRRSPVPSNQEQALLIEAGHRQHDNQDYDGAIGRYTDVLRLNPDNVEALFDLTASYYDSRDFHRCLETARRGAEYESEHIGYFYLMIGTSYDMLKQSQKAVGAYKEGLVLEPDNYLLHYNLGITYLHLERLDNARECFKQALLINPNHTSSHIGLGQVYFQQGYRIPALMALSRAVILESGSSRAETSILLIGDLLRLERSGKMGKGESEGRFAEIEAALRQVAPRQAGDEAALGIARLNGVMRVLATADSATMGKGFAVRYYLPYFVELARRGYADPFAHYIHQAQGDPDVVEWLQQNAGRVREFLAWSRDFHWAEADRR